MAKSSLPAFFSLVVAQISHWVAHQFIVLEHVVYKRRFLRQRRCWQEVHLRALPPAFAECCRGFDRFLRLGGTFAGFVGIFGGGGGGLVKPVRRTLWGPATFGFPWRAYSLRGVQGVHILFSFMSIVRNISRMFEEYAGLETFQHLDCVSGLHCLTDQGG